jgi:hypothetical protein
MFLAQLGEAVVGDAGEFRGPVGAGHALERRQPKGDDLRVILERVHHPQARIEVMDRADALDALADVGRAAGGAGQEIEDLLRKEVAEGVDVAHGQRRPLLDDGVAVFGTCSRRRSCDLLVRSTRPA